MQPASLPSSWKLLDAHPEDVRDGRIICVANQKGGVGKTTTAVNLAAALALRGHRILLVDIDPQANATTGVGVDHSAATASAYDLLLGENPLDEVAAPTAIPGLDVVAGSLDLAGAEVELVSSIARESQLAGALAGSASRYEIVFIDCPPSLGLLTINALVAAHDLIVPIQCEYYALEGLGQLLSTAERVRRAFNPELRISGFLLTMFDARTKLAGQVAEEIRSHFPDIAFETVIPRSVRLSEAPSFGEPVLTLDPSSRGAITYRLLAAEVEARYGLEVHPPPPPPPNSEEGEEASAHESDPVDDRAPQEVAVPGPGGRGYGTKSSEPSGLDHAWPPRNPWARRERRVQ
jgi:chromosome partitioning protein